MRLPVDIFHALFELLANEDEGPDVSTLSVCCQVSSEISNICESYLYICLHITCGDRGDDRLDRNPRYNPQCGISATHLETIIAAKPHIGQYIKTLGIYWVHPDPLARQQLSDLLQRLQVDNIPALHVFSSYVATWDQMGPPIQAFIQNILKYPNLKMLEVGNIDYFPLHATFLPHSSLRSLGISMITLADITGARVSDDNLILPWVKSSIPLDNLFLEVLATDVMADTLLRLRRADGEPLMDLSLLSQLLLTFNYAYMERDIQLACSIMRQSRSLRRISFNVQTETISEILSDALQTTKDTLESLALASHPAATCPLGNIPHFLNFKGCTFTSLKCIKIRFYLYNNSKGVLVDNGGWSSMAEVLRDRRRFPCLKKVEVGMKFSGWPAEPREMVDQYLKLGQEVMGGRLREEGIVLEAEHFLTHERFI